MARYFADEQPKIDDLTAVAEEAARAVEEYIEENTVEDGLLAEAMEDDKITKVLASSRLREAKHEGSDPEEVAALEHLLKLYDAEAAAKKAAREAQAKLDLATLKRYGNLAEDEVKILVLDDKWKGTIIARIASEVDSLTLALVFRVEELGERYAKTLSELDVALEQAAAKVNAYLADMGVQ